MAKIFLVLYLIYMNFHLTESELFHCSRPEYDQLEEKEPGVCLYTLCVHCVSTTTTFQNLTYTLAVEKNGTVWTLDKENALYSTEDNSTHITFPFNASLGFSLFDGPVRFQFSVSALEEDGNVINETNPWTAPEQFNAPDFMCGSPDFDRSQTPRYEMCRLSFCVQCVSNVTYQQINATLGFLVKDFNIDGISYTFLFGHTSNETTFYLTEDNKTMVTFLFEDSFMEVLAFRDSAQCQFSMSAVDFDGRSREEFSPLSEPFKYEPPTEIYFTINGKNDSFIEESVDTMVFLCTSNGYPPPLLYLDSYIKFGSDLFDDMLISPDTPVNITVRDRLVTGLYYCRYNGVGNFVEKKIFVLSHSQLRLYTNSDKLEDIDYQSVGVLDFEPYMITSFPMIGYPAPNSMQLLSNGVNITKGVELTYVYNDAYIYGDILINFTDQALLQKQTNYTLTVNNGRTASFTFVCGNCDEFVFANSCTIKSNIMHLAIFLLAGRLYWLCCI